jgi:hypothetical protein
VATHTDSATIAFFTAAYDANGNTLSDASGKSYIFGNDRADEPSRRQCASFSKVIAIGMFFPSGTSVFSTVL